MLHPLKFRRFGALERINRLFRVTHHKDRTLHIITCARSGGEFARKAVDHAPLHGAGILCLVHQNVVDPAIQLEQHPRRHGWIGQKRTRFQDQIIEIQPAARQFGGLVFLHEHMREAVQNLRASRVMQSQALVPRVLDPRHKVVQLIHDGRAGA